MVDPLEIYWGLSETVDILSFLFSHEMLTSKTAVWKHREKHFNTEIFSNQFVIRWSINILIWF